MVGSNEPASRAAFNAHIADRHPSFHGKTPDGRTGVFNKIPRPSAGCNFGDDVQDHILGRDPLSEITFNIDPHPFGFWLKNTLGGQNHFHFAGPNSKGHAAESPVRRSVTVAADNGHPRLRDPQLGANDVHNALEGMIQPVKGNPVFLTVLSELVDLEPGKLVPDGKMLIHRGDIVIGRRNRILRAENRYAPPVNSGKCLWTGHFVDKMPVDIKDAGSAFDFFNNMGIPYFVKKSFSCQFDTI